MTDAFSLSSRELARIDAWWRAANYLSVGQVYLLDNPLLREPLKRGTPSQGFSDMPMIRDWQWPG